jgi:ankyrin repeat protein
LIKATLAKNEGERTVQVLLQTGADKNVRDTYGEKAYEKAAKLGYIAIMHVLW